MTTPKTDTPTPLTNKEAQDDFLVCPETGELYVTVDFARTLERQLAESRQQIQMDTVRINEMQETGAKLEVQLAESQQREQGLREAVSYAEACLISWKEYDKSNPSHGHIEVWSGQDEQALLKLRQAISTPRGEAMVPKADVEKFCKLIEDSRSHETTSNLKQIKWLIELPMTEEEHQQFTKFITQQLSPRKEGKEG